MLLIRKWGRIREFPFFHPAGCTDTHKKTVLANNPALSRNMHCKHSWLIAETLLNPANNQIFLPQYKQRWQRQTHTGEGGARASAEVSPSSKQSLGDTWFYVFSSFFFFKDPPLKEEEKKHKLRQKGAQYVMRLNKWTHVRKDRWEQFWWQVRM